MGSCAQHMQTFFIQNVASHLLQHFTTLETNRERIDFAYDHVVSQNDLFTVKKIKKCNATSLVFREEGNRLYTEQDQSLAALLLYTRSIAYAEGVSPHLAFAFANRSVALLEEGFYNECLEDIERALKHNYPDNLKHKLFGRQKHALKLKANSRFIRFYEPAPTITKKNPQILSAADCVELSWNESLGTHEVITTRDVKAGEVISVEKPYVQSVLTEDIWLHCHECLELCFNLIPCDNCPLALYCSASCKNSSWESFHRYECGLKSSFMGEVFIRLTLSCIKEYNSLDKDDDDKRYRSDRYREIYRLKTTENNLDQFELLGVATKAATIFHALKNFTSFLQDNDLDENTLKDILFHNVLIQMVNTSGVLKHRLNAGDLGAKNYSFGAALYSFTSCYSHSCDANCETVFHGTTFVVRANRNIPKGETCALCYQWDFLCHDYAFRQRQLQINYHFTCKCVACEKVWPTVNELITQTRTEKELLVLAMLFEMQKGLVEDPSEVNREHVLSRCFKMEADLPKPCFAMFNIHNVISWIISYPGNRCVIFQKE